MDAVSVKKRPELRKPFLQVARTGLVWSDMDNEAAHASPRNATDRRNGAAHDFGGKLGARPSLMAALPRQSTLVSENAKGFWDEVGVRVLASRHTRHVDRHAHLAAVGRIDAGA